LLSFSLMASQVAPPTIGYKPTRKTSKTPL
jgi:hypothetical protein